MPNFQTKILANVQYPIENNGVKFHYKGNCDNESLILCTCQDEEFFIKQIIRKNDILVKGDKLAKPSCVKILQDALQSYQNVTKSTPRFSNIQSKKNRLQKQDSFFKNLDFFANDFEKYASNFNATCIEVGFGSGRHLLYQASKNQKTLYIGVEIHKPSIEQVLKQIHLQKLQNILIIDCDARILLEFFNSNTIDIIYVHFPIPWDKKPHRRVINEKFLDESTRVLKCDGKVQLRTDSDNFFNYSLECMLKYLHVNVTICKNKDLQITSKYEARWKKMNKNIYDLTFINEKISNEIQKPCVLQFNYDVTNHNIDKHTHLEQDWFVHFEALYKVSEDCYFWKVSFGDTSQVEHCYILVNQNKANYFPKNIYATKSNINAHEYILQKLYL